MRNEDIVIQYKQNQDGRLLNKLIENNSGIINRLLRKYHSPDPLHSFEDLKQIATIGLHKACLAYDQDKNNKFITLASNVMENELNNYRRSDFRRMKNAKYTPYHKVSCEERMFADDNLDGLTHGDKVTYEVNVFDDVEAKEDYCEFKKALKYNLSSQQLEIISLIEKGYEIKELHTVLGISRQAVHDRMKRIKKVAEKYKYLTE